MKKKKKADSLNFIGRVATWTLQQLQSIRSFSLSLWVSCVGFLQVLWTGYRCVRDTSVCVWRTVRSAWTAHPGCILTSHTTVTLIRVQILLKMNEKWIILAKLLITIHGHLLYKIAVNVIMYVWPEISVEQESGRSCDIYNKVWGLQIWMVF